MSLVPKVFRRSGEGAIASYNFTDIAEGTGIVTFYGFAHTNSATTTYALTTNPVYSEPLYTTNTASTAEYVKITDIDFDTTFNTPKRIKGKVRATYTISSGDGSATKYGSFYVIMIVKKYSGTTETELATTTGPTITGLTNYRIYRTYNVVADVATLTNFKKGDTFRITIEVYGKMLSSGTAPCLFLHDPKNRLNAEDAYEQGIPQDASSHTASTSIFQVNVPFVLDL